MVIHLTNQRFLLSKTDFFKKLRFDLITFSAMLGPLSLNREIVVNFYLSRKFQKRIIPYLASIANII